MYQQNNNRVNNISGRNVSQPLLALGKMEVSNICRDKTERSKVLIAEAKSGKRVAFIY